MTSPWWLVATLVVTPLVLAAPDPAASLTVRGTQCASTDLRIAQYGTTGAAAGTLAEGFALRSRRRCQIHGIQRVALVGSAGTDLKNKVDVPGRQRLTISRRHPLFFDLYFHNPGASEHPRTVSSRSTRVKLYGIPGTFVVVTRRLSLLVEDQLSTSSLSRIPSGGPKP